MKYATEGLQTKFLWRNGGRKGQTSQKAIDRQQCHQNYLM